MATNISDSIQIKPGSSNELTTGLPPFISNIYNSVPVNYISDLLHGVTKYTLIAILVAYLIIALLTIKQISLMTKTVETSTNTAIFLLGYIHLFAVVVCLLYTLFVIWNKLFIKFMNNKRT